MNPKFSEVLRAAASGLMKSYIRTTDAGVSYLVGAGENSGYEEARSKANMLNAIAELYEMYENKE